VSPGADSSVDVDPAERGLYRTLRRLAATGLLTASEVAVPRTGAKRKNYELKALGARYLARIRGELLDR